MHKCRNVKSIEREERGQRREEKEGGLGREGKGREGKGRGCIL